MKKTGLLALALLLIASFGLGGCSGENKSGSGDINSPGITAAPPRGLSGTLSTGKTEAAASGKIAPAGGSITVSEAGTPLSGMELKIPAGAYKEPREFKITYAPIEKHTFGEDFNPVTPLISVDNGGIYADQDILISLPVKIPEGKFGMGFLYNEKTKILEGMPVMAQSASSITVATRHFSSFVISLIDKFKLKKDIDTGFRPGADDWQFINRGSYIASAGHCAGQSISAMWYYYAQPDGKDLTLFGRYDNNGKQPATPGFQEDDSLSYRLASVVQTDLDWDSWASQFFANQRGVNDELAWDMFAYSMQFTRQPQYVTMLSDSDKSHAMICYRIKDGNLYIADPNYPGNTERRIEYVNNKFKPYESGANKDEIDAGKSISYNKIGYCAQSARVDWSKMSQRWVEFKNRSIGSNKFPVYTIVYKDEKGQFKELTDGLTFPSNLIVIDVSAQFGKSFNVFRDGKALPWDANGAYELKPGNNLLGVCVYGQANNKAKYVDFKYFNILNNGLSLKPALQEGTPNQSLIFNLELSQPAPKDSKFEWYVDGKLNKTGAEFSIRVAFPEAGKHSIAARVVDSQGKVVLQAQGIADIKEPARATFTGNNLAAIQKMLYMTVMVKGRWGVKSWTASGEKTADSLFTFNIPWWPQPRDPDLEISWSGTSFSGKKSIGSGNNLSSGEVKGTVSADGKTLSSLEWSYKSSSDNGTANSPWKTETTTIIKLQNVPIPQLVFEKATENHFNVVKNGADVKNYVSEVSYHTVTYRNGQKESEGTSVLNSIKWDATDFQGQPALNVGFEVNRAYYPG